MAKKTGSKPKTRRTRLLALEPRMLFDGALGIDIAAAQASAAAHADPHVDAEAHTAEAGIRGAVPHGTEGVLQIDAASLDVFSMAKTYGQQLSEIGQHLSQDADILVYGCDFGKGDMGRAAATELSWLTKADVASSTDLTGAADLGGNWALERQVGHIETNIAFSEGAQRTFHNVMETLDWDKQTWVAEATAGSYSLAGGTVSVTLTLRNADGSLAAGNPYTAGYPADGQALSDGDLAQNNLH